MTSRCHDHVPEPIPTYVADLETGSRPAGRSIYLSPLSIEVIRSLEREPGCRWLIPGKDTTKHLGSIDKAWALVCRRASLAVLVVFCFVIAVVFQVINILSVKARLRGLKATSTV